MRIAVFHELNSGGARRGANEFALTFKKLGHTVDFYSTDEQFYDEKKYYSNIFRYPFHAVHWSGGNWKPRLYRDTVELFKLCFLHRKIAQDVDRSHYDFVLIHPSKYTQAPFLLRWLRTLKLYYCQETLRMVYEPIFEIPRDLHPAKKMYEQCIRFIRKVIDRQNIRGADYIFANSTYTQSNIFNAYHLKSTVCHMGVDAKVFYPSGQKSVDLLFVGTRDENEGFALFQQAIKYMKYKRAKIHYLLRGENWTSNDRELRSLYAKSNIVLCFGYNEPFGLIPIEAMACGATVIALNEGGYKDSVKNGKTGVLVEKDAKEIARACDRLLQNRKKLVVMQKAAIKDMQTYWTWARGAKQILQVALTFRDQ